MVGVRFQNERNPELLIHGCLTECLPRREGNRARQHGLGGTKRLSKKGRALALLPLVPRTGILLPSSEIGDNLMERGCGLAINQELNAPLQLTCITAVAQSNDWPHTAGSGILRCQNIIY